MGRLGLIRTVGLPLAAGAIISITARWALLPLLTLVSAGDSEGSFADRLERALVAVPALRTPFDWTISALTSIVRVTGPLSTWGLFLMLVATALCAEIVVQLFGAMWQVLSPGGAKEDEEEEALLAEFSSIEDTLDGISADVDALHDEVSAAVAAREKKEEEKARTAAGGPRRRRKAR